MKLDIFKLFCERLSFDCRWQINRQFFASVHLSPSPQQKVDELASIFVNWWINLTILIHIVNCYTIHTTLTLAHRYCIYFTILSFSSCSRDILGQRKVHVSLYNIQLQIMIIFLLVLSSSDRFS